MSKKTGIPSATYSRAVKLIQKASEEVKENLRNGKGRIFKEYKKLQYEEKRQQQLEDAKKLDPSFMKDSEMVRLLLGDFKEVCKQFPDESIDLILTDPLYAYDHLHDYGDVAKVAARKLKKGGSLVTYTGNYFLPEVLDQLRTAPELKYLDVFIMRHNGASIRTPKSNLIEKVKVILWFVKEGAPIILSGKIISRFAARFMFYN